jgi:site-specific recombinase XerD
MRTKKASVKVTDFKAHIESWCLLRTVMHHQPSSIEASRKDLKVFIRFCSKKKIRRITGLTLVKFLSYLRNERGNRSGSINRKRSTLRCYFNHLRLRQVNGAEKFPIEHLPRARQPYSGPVTTLDQKETARLLDSIDRSSVVGLRDFTLFFLLYALGLRLGEALCIRLPDIDWENGMLTVHGKGRKLRRLPLPDKVKKMLKEWLFCRGALLNAEKCDWLFLSRKGNRLSHRTAEEHFSAIVKAAGPFTLEKVTPHSLRHAFASHVIDNNNSDILVVKTILGHANLRTTEIYLHPSVETLRKAVNNHLSNDLLEKAIVHHRGVVRINHRRISTA